MQLSPFLLSYFLPALSIIAQTSKDVKPHLSVRTAKPNYEGTPYAVKDSDCRSQKKTAHGAAAACQNSYATSKANKGMRKSVARCARIVSRRYNRKHHTLIQTTGDPFRGRSDAGTHGATSAAPASRSTGPSSAGVKPVRAPARKLLRSSELPSVGAVLPPCVERLPPSEMVTPCTGAARKALRRLGHLASLSRSTFKPHTAHGSQSSEHPRQKPSVVLRPFFDDAETAQKPLTSKSPCAFFHSNGTQLLIRSSPARIA